MDKLVSIVIPAYNAGRFIEATLTSAITQTWPALEIVVVNDGSSDDTAAIVRRVMSMNANVRLVSQPNGGVASARNLGIMAARGAYVAFLDADDLWHPEKIRAQMEVLCPEGQERYQAAFSLHVRIDDQGYVFSVPEPNYIDAYDLRAHIVHRPVGNGSSLIVRRDIAIAVGGFSIDYAQRGVGGCEDLDFELKISAHYPIACVPHYHVGYRVYDGNMSSNRLRMVRSIHETIRRHLDAHPELPFECRKSAIFNAYEYSVSSIKSRDTKEFLRHVGGMVALDAPGAAAFVFQDAMRTIWQRGSRTVRKRLSSRQGVQFTSFVEPNSNIYREGRQCRP